MADDNDIQVGPEDAASGINQPTPEQSVEKRIEKSRQDEGFQQRMAERHERDASIYEALSDGEVEDEPFNDEETRVSRDPSAPPVTPSDGAVNIPSLIADNYGIARQRALQMCMFGTVTVGGKEWTDKQNFSVPYEDITGQEIIVIEPGGQGVRFRYGG